MLETLLILLFTAYFIGGNRDTFSGFFEEEKEKKHNLFKIGKKSYNVSLYHYFLLIDHVLAE